MGCHRSWSIYEFLQINWFNQQHFKWSKMKMLTFGDRESSSKNQPLLQHSSLTTIQLTSPSSNDHHHHRYEGINSRPPGVQLKTAHKTKTPLWPVFASNHQGPLPHLQRLPPAGSLESGVLRDESHHSRGTSRVCWRKVINSCHYHIAKVYRSYATLLMLVLMESCAETVQLMVFLWEPGPFGDDQLFCVRWSDYFGDFFFSLSIRSLTSLSVKWWLALIRYMQIWGMLD